MTGWRDTRPSAQNPESRFSAPPDPATLRQLHDAHCHPTDDENFKPEVLQQLDTGKFCVMSSSLLNQDKTKRVYKARPDDVIPCFGLHPWFCHSISLCPPDSLPTKEAHYASLFPHPDIPNEPHPALSYLVPHLPSLTSIDTFLSTLERDLSEFPTSFVGEIGLDKAFKLPHPPALFLSTSSLGREDRLPKNSPLTTPIEHQLRIVQAQIELAIKLGRNVSQHCVRSTFDTVELLKRLKKDNPGFETIYVCLHSFGASAETAKQIQKSHPNVFFSFSTIISGRSPNFYKLLRAIEPDRLLLESDFSTTSEIDRQVWEVFEAVCHSRDWTREQTLETLRTNWTTFTTQSRQERVERIEAKGGGQRGTSGKGGKERKRERHNRDLYVSEDEEEEGQRKGIE